MEQNRKKKKPQEYRAWSLRVSLESAMLLQKKGDPPGERLFRHKECHGCRGNPPLRGRSCRDLLANCTGSTPLVPSLRQLRLWLLGFQLQFSISVIRRPLQRSMLTRGGSRTL